VSKERAKRRAERLAVLEREKAARARKVARRQRRRQVVRKMTPRVGRSGRLYRRGRRERVGIVLVPLVAAAAVWLFVPDLALRVVLTIVIVAALPAMVVVILDKEKT
jgi:Flp pilus assembly protein TadB